MPVDAVLVGSRCMVALEAATSAAVKDLIVAAPGVADEAHWERSYTGDAGGVITVQSEHVSLRARCASPPSLRFDLVDRFAPCCCDLDANLFSLCARRSRRSMCSALS